MEKYNEITVIVYVVMLVVTATTFVYHSRKKFYFLDDAVVFAVVVGAFWPVSLLVFATWQACRFAGWFFGGKK